MSATDTTRANSDAAGPALAAGSYSLRGRLLLFLIPAVVGLIADLSSKHWVFSQQELRDHQIWWIVPDYMGLQLSLNEGALFGMGQGFVWVFATFAVIAAIGLPTWLFRYGAVSDAWLTFALGCIMAGILGNLFDRLGLHGETWWYDPERIGTTAYAVRDWILLQWGDKYRWPNFNIADSLLVAGAGIVLLKAFFEKPVAARS
jgi:signal peptidase II